MAYLEFWNSLSAKQRKELGARLRNRVDEFVASIGGTVAKAKFYGNFPRLPIWQRETEVGYGEGFVCCYCVDRRIVRIRVYANGCCYGFDENDRILFREVKPEWNELSTPANV